MTLTRRTALTAPALLALPAAALARKPEAPDPAVAAFEAWRVAFIANAEMLAEGREDTPEGARIEAEAWTAFCRFADAIPTTLEGMALKLRGGLLMVGEQTRRASEDPRAWKAEDFDFYDWSDDLQRRWISGLIEGVEAMAARA
jgi:hypothetical protein